MVSISLRCPADDRRSVSGVIARMDAQVGRRSPRTATAHSSVDQEVFTTRSFKLPVCAVSYSLGGKSCIGEHQFIAV